jgi:hypothetical protein
MNIKMFDIFFLFQSRAIFKTLINFINKIGVLPTQMTLNA